MKKKNYLCPYLFIRILENRALLHYRRAFCFTCSRYQELTGLGVVTNPFDPLQLPLLIKEKWNAFK